MTMADGTQKPGFYDFFAGGGMAHPGLENRWLRLKANDFSARKARALRRAHPHRKNGCGSPDLFMNIIAFNNRKEGMNHRAVASLNYSIGPGRETLDG